MRDLREVLKGSFESHANALGDAASSWDRLAERSTRDTRNRRAWRAGAASSVAAAAVVGIVATAIAVNGGGDGGDALNPAQRLVMGDPNSLGECTAYIPANGAVLPDGWYLGRAYVDSASDFVVAVTPDGTATRVQPDPNGDYSFDFGGVRPTRLWSSDYPEGMAPTVGDYVRNTGGGDIWVDANPVGWDWSVEPLSPAPDGVDVDSMYATFAMALGFGGQGYVPSDIPAGAVAEAVAIYADGHEVAGALVRDAPFPHDDDIDVTDLIAIALRVTLADGEVWEIRADYTPENVPDLPCQPTPPSGPFEWPSQEPAAASEPGASQGPATDESLATGGPLAGPESEVFQCAAALPAEREDAGDVTARRASGIVELDGPDVFDVGDEGVVIEAGFPLWEIDIDSLDEAPRSAGWQTTGSSQGDGPFYGNVGFTEVVALRDGVIVAAAATPVEDWTAGGVGGAMLAYRNTGDPLTGGFISAINGIDGLLEPCGDATAGDLEDAQLAVLYGFGPDVADMSYGWTLVAQD